MKLRIVLSSALAFAGLVGCGQANNASVLRDASGSAGSREAVLESFAGVIGHTICSGKITEEWTDAATGKKIRQFWERRAGYRDLVKDEAGFKVAYDVKVHIENFEGAADGSWQPTTTADHDSALLFKAQWDEARAQYAGATEWLYTRRNGEAMESSKRWHKTTSIGIEAGKLSLRYVDMVPNTTDYPQPIINSYVESLGLNQGKLERNWSYKQYSYDEATQSAGQELDLGAQPSFDTEAKCAE